MAPPTAAKPPPEALNTFRASFARLAGGKKVFNAEIAGLCPVAEHDQFAVEPLVRRRVI